MLYQNNHTYICGDSPGMVFLGGDLMIKYTQGDILQANTEALVNTVNCVGVMGRGIALQFKKAFPDNFKAYAVACRREEVQPGRMFLFETGQIMPMYIINFPTKRHWRGKSRITDIETGLVALVQEIKARNIRSIAIPPLGSGLGGLDWSKVKKLIEQSLKDLPDVDIQVFEPNGMSPDKRVNNSTEVPAMTAGRAALVGLMHRYQTALLDPTITLLEVHKLMYFLQNAGEPLRLRFVKAHYGPYAENLRHLLIAIEGHFVAGYADGGDTPDKQLMLVPGVLKDAKYVLEKNSATYKRFERVAKLVEGFETPVGLELLSTVHWLMKEEHIVKHDDLVKAMYDWVPRKRQFTPAQIELAAERLHAVGF